MGHTLAVKSLLELSHQEARRLVRSGAPVYLTINPVEYHGPHLSLHNDRLISLGLVHDLHSRLAKRHDWPLLIGTDLEVGVEPCPGPGTRRTPFPIARHLIREACRALAELGAEKIVLMTFHGAPLHNLALEAGVRLLRERGIKALSPFNAILHELLWLDTSKFEDAFTFISDPTEREEMRRTIALDFHAGFFETSMTLYYAPASVAPDYRAVPPCPEFRPNRSFTAAARLARLMGADQLARELDFAAAGLGWTAMRPFPGYTGRPHLASAQAGAVFAQQLIDGYEKLAEDVFADRASSPPPIMPWVEKVSLGGRIGNLAQPTETLGG
jgi:creatinine amidohydrolase